MSTAPSASPGPTPSPDLGTAAKGGGTPKPIVYKEQDTFDSRLVNRDIYAYAMATPDLPLQSPSLPLTTNSDIASVGPSRELTVERIGDHPQDPSHFRHDIV